MERPDVEAIREIQFIDDHETLRNTLTHLTDYILHLESETPKEIGGGLHAIFFAHLQISKVMADSLRKTQEGIEQLRVALQKKEEIKPIHAHRVDALRKIDTTKNYIRAALEDYKNSDSFVFYEGENVVRKILTLLS